MRRIALIALTALIATPALAGKGKSETGTSDATATMPAQAASGAKAEQKICRRYENTVSRMKAETLCLTKEEWRKFDDQQ